MVAVRGAVDGAECDRQPSHTDTSDLSRWCRNSLPSGARTTCQAQVRPMPGRSRPVNVLGLVASPRVVRRGCLVVLLRLAYLGVTNTLAMLRLLPMSGRAKDAEILALRHQITVLERQLHDQRIRFTAADRALPSALLHRLPRTVLRADPAAGATRHHTALAPRPLAPPRWTPRAARVTTASQSSAQCGVPGRS
jgi:hypothetical protein